jgi:hypothetical protein
MSKRQAYAVDIVVSCLVTWTSVILLNAIGAGEEVQFVAAMLGIVGGAMMAGAILVHYVHKREAAEAQERERR